MQTSATNRRVPAGAPPSAFFLADPARDRGSPQPGVQIGQQSCHLLSRKATRKRRHHSLARQDHALHISVARRGSAGQSRVLKDRMQIGRDFLERQIVVLVAMGAANVVKVLPFELLVGESRLTAASSQNDRQKDGKSQQANQAGSTQKTRNPFHHQISFYSARQRSRAPHRIQAQRRITRFTAARVFFHARLPRYSSQDEDAP